MLPSLLKKSYCVGMKGNEEEQEGRETKPPKEEGRVSHKNGKLGRIFYIKEKHREKRKR